MLGKKVIDIFNNFLIKQVNSIAWLHEKIPRKYVFFWDVAFVYCQGVTSIPSVLKIQPIKTGIKISIS